MGSDDYTDVLVSMPVALKQEVESRVTGSLFAEDGGSVIARDLARYYEGLLKPGIETLRNAGLSADERRCVGSLLMSTSFMDPSDIPHLMWSLEESQEEMQHHFGVDPAELLTKMRSLDVLALYALMDLIERDPTMSEIA